MNSKNQTICIIGLGYVGLPLAVEFGKSRKVIGFDLNTSRISNLKNNHDFTKELEPQEIAEAIHLKFSSKEEDLGQASIFIITVPTPIDKNNDPDLQPLIKASAMVGKALKKGDIVIYESTVYPGATEEECVPVLESFSGLKFNNDFYCGYSPERINPGDKQHKLKNIVKVTSGSNAEIAEIIDQLYNEIIDAGTHKAESIKVAEAAKVIENTQRDLNIALMNELSIIFNKLDIDTEAVLRAAGSKWNFLPFRPGLVGGHCIGVDPYYLTHKAQLIGYNPEIILAGRRLNDSMSAYVASCMLSELKRNSIDRNNTKILILGLSFKENCPDIRNTKVIDLINELKSNNCEVDVYDPWVSVNEAESEYGIKLISTINKETYDGIILAVAHTEFKDLGAKKIKEFAKEKHVFYDLKYVFDEGESSIRL
ncbi:Vi polysaccharide biosynthesis UDP-N-acetylglucosamine C-6 dehydrogenase TviB [Gammaproteobacteria bacterium]|nr:Vi polysaccharide biosynthesis UDP-N-acetylglucosamine C-6 dehydrogenase TviB [Gammaproteobacteria bacterium]